MGTFDDILKTVTEEDRAVLDKYNLRAPFEKLENDYAQTATYAANWLGWQERNWDSDAGMTRREKELSDKLAASEAKLVTAVAPGSGASASEIQALRTDFEKKIKESQEASMRTLEGMNTFYGAAAAKMLPHQQEFGQNLNPTSLLKFMQDNRISDPELAYDKMVEPLRKEAAGKKQVEVDAQHLKDIEQARADERQKIAQERAMGPNGLLPDDHTGGIAGVTARMEQPAQVSDEVKKAVSEAKGGDGTLARLGYEMFRRGDFSTTQQ